MSKVFQYLKDTRSELKHVNWPTQRQTWWFTVIVILISILIAAYIGVFDWIFTGVLENLI